MALGLFKSSVLLTKGAPIARTAEMGILKVNHRHSHAAAETEIGAWVDVGMGSCEGRGEGLGMGTCVGMGMGNYKVGQGVGNGVGCEGGQDMGQSNDPNLIFEGDFHPMPSGWAETKLSFRHGDEEHAVVPQPAAPFIGTTKSRSKSARAPTGQKILVALHPRTRIGLCRSTKAAIPRLGCRGRRHRETKQDEGYQRAPSVQG